MSVFLSLWALFPRSHWISSSQRRSSASRKLKFKTRLQSSSSLRRSLSVEELQNAVLIDLQPGAQNALDRSESEKALRVLQTDGELVTATTLIPYSEENGKLVNRFALAAETWPIHGGTSDFNVGGIVLSIQVQYHKKLILQNLWS